MRAGLDSERIPVSGPWITEREIAYVTEAVREAWYASANVFHERFERTFAEYIGTRFAVALPSCTSAIHLSLLALGVGPGDEVIVPDCTWIASAAPVTYVGATPVFADIQRDTWCLDPQALQACLTPRTKAVIPVNLYGSMAAWDAIAELAKRHRFAIVEDAAESVGSEYHGKRSGSFGDTGVFSFHGSKTLTTGEGGMLVTDREDLHARVLFLRDHGRPPGDSAFYNTEVAWKYKMSSMQAALGLAQVERVEELVARKREIFDWYREELGNLPGTRLNAEPPGVRNSYWMITLTWEDRPEVERNDLASHLRDEGIDTRPFFHPLSSLPAYAGTPQAEAARARNKVSYALSPYALNLPSALNLTRAQVQRVSATLVRYFQGTPATT